MNARGFLRLVAGFAVVVVGGAFEVGCSGTDTVRPPPDEGGGWGPGVATGPCEADAERECWYKLDQANGAISCFVGQQFCDEGTWSGCSIGTVVQRPDTSWPGYREYFAVLPPLSSPEWCGDANVCDPNCWHYFEDPVDIPGGGGPSGGLPDFPGMPEIVSCSHDLCTTGAALTSGCNSCVATVCSEPGFADCCQTGWTNKCVDAVYELCASRQPPFELCDFAVFADTSVSFSGGYVRGAPIGAANTGSTGNGVEVNQGNTIHSIVTNGNVRLDNTTVDGDITLSGSTIQTQNTVNMNGNEYLGQTLTFPEIPTKTLSCLSVSGSVSTNSSTVTVSPGDARELIINNDNGVIILNGPGSYGAVTFQSAGTLVFRGPGTYTLRRLVMGANNPRLLFPPSTAGNDRVNIDVCDELEFQNATRTLTYTSLTVTEPCASVVEWQSGASAPYLSERKYAGSRYRCDTAYWNSCPTVAPPLANSGWSLVGSAGACATTVNLTAGTAQPEPFDVIWYTNDTSVKIGPGALASGVIIAPHATVDIYNSNGAGEVNGLIWAKQVTSTGSDVRINATGLTGETCRNAGIVSPPTYECPIPIGTPAVPPAINEPCGTGLDCQINHRCVGPLTSDLRDAANPSGACPHSKCVPGVAMTPACAAEDDCVRRICAVDSACCSGAWSQSCVDRVATVCDAVCTPPSCLVPDACSPNPSGIALGCNSCTDSVIAALPSCATNWTMSCVFRLYEVCGGNPPFAPGLGDSICDYAAYGRDQVQIQGTSSNRSTILGGSWVGSPTVASMTIQYVDLNTSNATSSGSLNLQFSDGSGHYLSGSGSLNTAFVTGGFSQLSWTPPTPTVTSRSFTCSSTDPAPTGGPIAPNLSYGNVVVPDGGTLTLSPGVYTFNSLTLGDDDGDTTGATLMLPTSGDVTINVCGRMILHTYSVMAGLSASSSMNLDIQTNQEFRANGNNVVYGYIHSARVTPSPWNNQEGNIWLGAGSYAYAILAADGRVDATGGGTTIDTRLVADACRARYPGSVIGTTPVRTDRLCAYSAYSKEGATFRGNITGNAGVAIGRSSDANASLNSAIIAGSLYVRGNADRSSGTSRVQGEVKSKGLTGSQVLNVVGPANYTASNASLPAPSFPDVSFTCDGTNTSVSSAGPGNYGDVELGGGNNIELTSTTGPYNFKSLRLQQNNIFTIPATGNITIRICGDFHIGNWNPSYLRVRTGATTFRAANASDAARIRIEVLGANVLLKSNDTTYPSFAGLLIAPNATVRLQDRSVWHGAIWARSVQMDSSNNRIDGSHFVGSVCAGQGVDALPACPATVTPQAGPEYADCRENSVGYTDSTCLGYDLAVGVPCGTTVPICNHGTVDFSGPVTVGYWAGSQRQMSLVTPTVLPPDGSCSGTLTVAAGNCADLSCPGIGGGGIQTLAVDPNNALSECNTRRMDNWSVHDGRSCSGGPSSYEYEYEGKCPGDMAPKWGILEWNTETSGTSRILFSGKVGDSSASAAAASYGLLGTAQASPDTQVCLAGSPCLVDLTAALGLDDNQGSFLHLKIDLDSSGGTPILRDWRVTYTCVYDQ